MEASFGETLRSVREARGLSLANLSKMIYFSKPLIGHIENGSRKPTPKFALALDEALNTCGLFTDLVQIGEDDDVYRRTLIKALGTLSGIGAIAPAAVAETLRRSLEEAASLSQQSDAWDSILTTYGRGFLTEPLSGLANRAVGDLMVLSANPQSAGRHGARLAMVYGSSVASLGDTVSAKRWYGTAVTLADQSGDSEIRAWSRARLAYRVFYEGGTDEEVLAATTFPIAKNQPSPALIEAHAARAHVFAARGDKPAAAQELAAAYRTLDVVSDQDDVSIYSMPSWRLAIAASWAHTALGDISKAQLAQIEAESLPAEAVRWRVQLDMHRAWGTVVKHDIDAGAADAHALLRTERSRVIHGLGKRVYSAVPHSERKRPAVIELAEALRQQ